MSRRLTGPRALGRLLGYLGGLGLLPEAPTEAPTLQERLLAEYRDYLVRERGLVAGSVPDFATALALSGDQQAAIGLFCGGTAATPDAPAVRAPAVSEAAASAAVPTAAPAPSE